MMNDKFQHAIVCSALVIIGARIHLALGIFLACCFAIGKEYYDASHGGEWDWNDILADVIGIVIGVELA